VILFFTIKIVTNQQVHHDLVEMNWLCCETCSKYFPDENVMALHNSHTHNKVNKALSDAARFEDAAQLDDMDGEVMIKMVRKINYYLLGIVHYIYFQS
jgi:hypothetical protein